MQRVGNLETSLPTLLPLTRLEIPPNSPQDRDLPFCSPRVTKQRVYKVPSSASSTRTFDYGHGGVPNWMSPGAAPNSSKPADLNATWRSYPAESPITPAFSPYTPHGPPPSATWGATPVGGETPSREDMHWSSYPAPPSRSLSFGSDAMTSHPQPYPPISQMASRPYDRKPSGMSAEMYPSPIATTIPGVETIPGTTIDQQGSLPAGAVGPAGSYEAWQQPYPYSKPGDAYEGWYGDQGSGEQSSSHSQHQPGSSMYYAER